jgi:hypothetical protein
MPTSRIPSSDTTFSLSLHRFLETINGDTKQDLNKAAVLNFTLSQRETMSHV